MRVVDAGEMDLDSWLDLVAEVEPLFGPMPDFAPVLRRNIRRGSALIVRDADGDVAGGILVGGSGSERRLTWLAVRRDCRGHGIGESLVIEALRRLPRSCTVSVITFGADRPDGHAARRLYERLGFAAREMVENGPEGGSRQRYTLVPGTGR